MSIKLRGPIKGNTRETPVEAEHLRNCLSDVLKGVQGQVVMDYEVDGILGYLGTEVGDQLRSLVPRTQNIQRVFIRLSKAKKKEIILQLPA